MSFFKPNMKKHWTQKYSEGFAGHEPDSTLIEAALKDALGPGSVLELGAGAGHFTKLVREWGYDITATDLVVISSSTLSGEVSFHFTEEPVPVIQWEQALLGSVNQ